MSCRPAGLRFAAGRLVRGARPRRRSLLRRSTLLCRLRLGVTIRRCWGAAGGYCTSARRRGRRICARLRGVVGSRPVVTAVVGLLAFDHLRRDHGSSDHRAAGPAAAAAAAPPPATAPPAAPVLAAALPVPAAAPRAAVPAAADPPAGAPPAGAGLGWVVADGGGVLGDDPLADGMPPGLGCALRPLAAGARVPSSPGLPELGRPTPSALISRRIERPMSRIAGRSSWGRPRRQRSCAAPTSAPVAPDRRSLASAP